MGTSHRLANEADPMGDGVPYHVESEFRSYLKCGILVHGFARGRCASCRYDFLVAFSCNGKRMVQTAARLHPVAGRSDQVLYVLSAPDLAGCTALRLSAWISWIVWPRPSPHLASTATATTASSPPTLP